MNDVNITDRITDIEYLRMALNLCQIHINYTQAHLIMLLIKALEVKGGEFSLKDAAKIHAEWDKYYDDYFDKISKNVIDNNKPT